MNFSHTNIVLLLSEKMFLTCRQASCHSNKHSLTTTVTKTNFSLVLLQYSFLYIRTLFQHTLQWNHTASWIQSNHHVIQIFWHTNRHNTIQSQHNFQGWFMYVMNLHKAHNDITSNRIIGQVYKSVQRCHIYLTYHFY